MTKRGKKRKRREDEDDEEEGRRWHEDLHPETKQSVWAIISFALATLLFLAWLGKAGVVGNSLSSVATLLFGKAFLVVPASFVLAGFSFLFGMRRHILSGTFFGLFLLLISALGLGGVFGGSEAAGYVGYGIAFAPLRFLDITASVLLFGALFIIAFLLMFNVGLIRRPREEDEKENEESNGVLEEKHGFFGRVFSLFRHSGKEDLSGEQVAAAERESQETESGAESEEESDVSPEYKENSEEDRILASPLRRRISAAYTPPPFDILENDRGKPSSGDVRANANIVQRTLQNFGIDVDMGEVSVGPSITQYTLKPAEGVKLSRITNLSSNLGLALAAHPLRIEAPIPGRSLVGIEVPNKSIAFVGLRSLLTELTSSKKDHVLGFALGRDVTGGAVFADISRMPHLLVAGSTGSGKSVTIHSLLMGLLFRNGPDALRLLLIDPKRVELPYYNGIPHLITPVITESKKAIQALRWAVKEMDRRYEQLQAAGARDIISHNSSKSNELMPYIVVIIDELADLMSAYPREVEASIVRLSQMARAVGIHLVVSTQRPSVNVITGLIKANITTRIALQVVSQIDSRTILDMAGAEKLLGKGDMLYMPGDAAKPRRIQGVYVSEAEVKRVTAYLRDTKEETDEETNAEDIFSETAAAGSGFDDDDADDELYEEARHIVIENQKASTSFLQRRLRLGYARAARLIDMLEDRGVVGPGEGAKPRDILMSREEVSGIPSDRHEV